MEVIGTLVGGIVYDFNNILLVIMGYIELLLIDILVELVVWKNLK